MKRRPLLVGKLGPAGCTVTVAATGKTGTGKDIAAALADALKERR